MWLPQEVRFKLGFVRGMWKIGMDLSNKERWLDFHAELKVEFENLIRCFEILEDEQNAFIFFNGNFLKASS